MKLNQLINTILVASVVMMSSCNRFLDEQSDMKLTIPKTLEDNQALLDRYDDTVSDFAGSGMVSSDEFYITDASYNALPNEEDKRLYTWQADHVSPSVDVGNDWNSCYKGIYISNLVLYNIDTYHIANAENIRGQALVLRAARMLDAAQTWCLVYNKSTATKDLGIVIRLDPDMNIGSKRATLQESYDQIIKDLNEAVDLLPVAQVASSRPSKVAALAFLARTYLYMGDYPKSLEYANKALALQKDLMDFNSLNPNDNYPIKDFNKEILLNATMALNNPIYFPVVRVPSDIYAMYEDNDLRKLIYFKFNAMGEITFRGNYTGSGVSKLTGVTVDEMYLIAAESYAQQGALTDGMAILNKLLVTRWKAGTYVTKTASTKTEALAIIATERRKELMFRGTRWSDLKRYNRDGANISLTKTVNAKVYTLPANDLRYAIAIPEEVIEKSGIAQNPR